MKVVLFMTVFWFSGLSFPSPRLSSQTSFIILKFCQKFSPDKKISLFVILYSSTALPTLAIWLLRLINPYEYSWDSHYTKIFLGEKSVEDLKSWSRYNIMMMRGKKLVDIAREKAEVVRYPLCHHSLKTCIVFIMENLHILDRYHKDYYY